MSPGFGRATWRSSGRGRRGERAWRPRGYPIEREFAEDRSRFPSVDVVRLEFGKNDLLCKDAVRAGHQAYSTMYEFGASADPIECRAARQASSARRHRGPSSPRRDRTDQPRLDEEHIAGGKRGRDHREHENDVGLAEQSRILALERSRAEGLPAACFSVLATLSLLHLVLASTPWHGRPTFVEGTTPWQEREMRRSVNPS